MSPCGVMVKAVDCGVIGSKLKLQSLYYVNFCTNTPGKCTNHLILTDMAYPQWLTLNTYLILLSVKKGGIKYHFKSLCMTRPGIEPRYLPDQWRTLYPPDQIASIDILDIFIQEKSLDKQRQKQYKCTMNGIPQPQSIE